MATNPSDNNRSPEEIERDLEQTRSEISRTIDAIQDKITPGQLANDAYGFIRSGSGDFAKSLGVAAKNNPVPFALMGVGLAWLVMGGGRTAPYMRRGSSDQYDNGESGIGRSIGNAVGAAGEYAQSAGDYARSATGYAASAGRATAGAASRAGRALFGAGRRAGETASGISNKMGDMTSGASERVRDLADDARELASEWSEDATQLAENARERMHRATEVVEERAMEMRDNANHLLREQPLVVGAIGLAVGAVLGALLPLTRRENELMGETRDQLLEQAKEKGQETLEQATETAKSVAAAAAEAAKSEAEKHSLTGGGADSDRSRQSGQTSDQRAGVGSFAEQPPPGSRTT